MREKLNSRLGFLMLAAGCAVGLGNVWRFPFVVGQNGGAAFVLVYLLFLALLGFPLLTAELAVGRGAKQGIAGAMRNLAPAKLQKMWGAVGTVIFAGNFLLMLYYTTVSGWLIKYFSEYALHSNMPGITLPAEKCFEATISSAGSSTLFMVISVFLATVICLTGVQKGVERVTKWMMLSLLALLTILAVKALTLEGAAKGVAFYLAPDWAKFMEHPVKAIFDAMGQAFFTLSVGVGCMTIFGSYIDRDHTLVKESIWIILIDTFVALLAGLIIFPACMAYGVDVTAGPGLIFIALPKVFANMPGGTIWGTVFFLFLSLAALTTIIAVFECLIGGLSEELKWPRARAALTVGCVVAILSLPCVFGFNLWSDVHPFGGTKTILDCEDFIFSQFWLPLGALATCIFAVWDFGWSFRNFQSEASSGLGLRLGATFKPYMRYILPLILLAVLVLGII